MKNKKKMISIISIALALLLVAFWLFRGFESDVYGNSVYEEGERSYSVSSSSDIATQVGMDILEAGGNAVDAAIAVSYALSVVEPYSNGLGGSGGMLVYNMNSAECTFLDYRASSGATETSEDYIAIPGMVRGMELAHQKYGSLPMSDLIQPAIDYARNGFKINETTANYISSTGSVLEKYDVYLNKDGNLLEAGDKLVQEELAQTLELIRDQGAEAFYNGVIAQHITDMSSLTVEDLQNYTVYEAPAVQGTYQGYTIYSANAPLSGITLLQMLEISDKIGMVNPTEDINQYVGQLEYISQLAIASRLDNITDPRTTELDMNTLVSDAYIDQLLTGVSEVREEDESIETTSFSVCDSDGLVVSTTNTLSAFFGSKKMVDGFFLNSTNANFSSGVNAYAPNKRSRTFTAPSIVVGNNGGYVMAIGTPGGNSIPGVLYGVLESVLKYGMDPQEAVDQQRMIYRNGSVYIESVDNEKLEWIDTSSIGQKFVWKDTGTWWGSVSIAGFSSDNGSFATFDTRRGATMAGTHN